MPSVSTDRSVGKKRNAWLHDLESLRCNAPRDFWRFLKTPLPQPEPELEEFTAHFKRLFGGDPESAVPEHLSEWLKAITHRRIDAQEVHTAIRNMKPSKSAALATFRIEYLRDHNDGTIL